MLEGLAAPFSNRCSIWNTKKGLVFFFNSKHSALSFTFQLWKFSLIPADWGTREVPKTMIALLTRLTATPQTHVRVSARTVNLALRAGDWAEDGRCFVCRCCWRNWKAAPRFKSQPQDASETALPGPQHGLSWRQTEGKAEAHCVRVRDAAAIGPRRPTRTLSPPPPPTCNARRAGSARARSPGPPLRRRRRPASSKPLTPQQPRRRRGGWRTPGRRTNSGTSPRPAPRRAPPPRRASTARPTRR